MGAGLTQVRGRTAWDIISTNLSDLIALADEQAATALNERMAVLDQIHKIHERSYCERGIIAREFERRELWRYLVDPDTRTPFASFTAWMSCSDFLGCRRVNFEAKGDVEELKDIPLEQLKDIPKGNLKVLKQLSSKLRQQPDVLASARDMSQNEFLEKLENEHKDQHLEVRRPVRFNPGRSGAKIVEECIAWAIEHDIAGNRDEALIRMAETALKDWQLDEELKDMDESQAQSETVEHIA